MYHTPAHSSTEPHINISEFHLIDTIDNARIDELLSLCQQTTWAKERTQKDLETILAHSMYFVLIHNDTQRIVGFIRTVTDFVRFAGIFDVIVDEGYRKKGIGTFLMQTLLNHPKLANVYLIELHCRTELIPFYKKLGFEPTLGTLNSLFYDRAKAHEMIKQCS